MPDVTGPHWACAPLPAIPTRAWSTRDRPLKRLSLRRKATARTRPPRPRNKPVQGRGYMSSETLSARLVEIEAMLDRSRRRFEAGSRLVEEAHQSLAEVQQLLIGTPI